MHGMRQILYGLDRHEPLSARLADRDISQLTRHLSAFVVAQPAELRKKNAAVGLNKPDLCGSRVAEGVASTLFLETRGLGPFCEEVGVGPFQVPKRLLERMHGRIRQPAGFGAVA